MSLEYAFNLAKDLEDTSVRRRRRHDADAHHADTDNDDWAAPTQAALQHDGNDPATAAATDDDDIQSVVSDDLGHGLHSEAAAAALRARDELVDAVDYFVQWKDALIETHPLPNAALLPLLTTSSQLIRCRDVLRNNVRTLAKLAQSFSEGLLGNEHVCRLKTETEQIKLEMGIEKARRIEATRKLATALSLVRRLDGEVRYVRWYRFFLKLRHREHIKHCDRTSAAARKSNEGLRNTIATLRAEIVELKELQAATSHVAIKNQTKADRLEQIVRQLERRERKLKASVDGAQATAAAAEKALNEVAKAAAEAKSQAQAEQGKKQVMLQDAADVRAPPKRGALTSSISSAGGRTGGHSPSSRPATVGMLASREAARRSPPTPTPAAVQPTASDNFITRSPPPAPSQPEPAAGPSPSSPARVPAAPSPRPASSTVARAAKASSERRKQEDVSSTSAKALCGVLHPAAAIGADAAAAAVPRSSPRPPSSATLAASRAHAVGKSPGLLETRPKKPRGPVTFDLGNGESVVAEASQASSAAEAAAAATAAAAAAADTWSAGAFPATGPPQLSGPLLTSTVGHVLGGAPAVLPPAAVPSVPLEVLNNTKAEHTSELMRVRKTHAAQVDVLKSTLATLQSKLLSRGKELSKLRKLASQRSRVQVRYNKKLGGAKFSAANDPLVPDAPWDSGSPQDPPVATATPKMAERPETVHAGARRGARGRGQDRRNGARGRKNTRGHVGFSMDDRAAGTQSSVGGSVPVPVPLDLALADPDAIDPALIDPWRSNRTINRPRTVHTTHYYMGPERAVTDSALTQAMQDGPLRLPANFMPLAPPRLAAQSAAATRAQARARTSVPLPVRPQTSADTAQRRRRTGAAGPAFPSERPTMNMVNFSSRVYTRPRRPGAPH